MKTTRRTLALFAVAASVAAVALAVAARGPVAEAVVPPPPAPPVVQRMPSTEKLPADSPLEAGSRRVQLALLLDTSSSMDGLIDQARRQLWRIVNELAALRREGKRARLEIALYEYGNSGIPSESGYIRRVLPLTTDLDRVSEKLFALTTNGGDEHCGQVIQAATRELEWSEAKDDLKLLFIAGNEPFDQGPVDPSAAVRAAFDRGIIVNTIHCDSEGSAEAEGWKAAARLVDGRFLTIDQNQVVQQLAAPQDSELAQLGAELNKTYLPYGSEGASGAARQQAQDKNAFGLSIGSFASRSVSKASLGYDNSGWDLVDAVNNDRVALEGLDEQALPEQMRGLSPSEQKAFLERQLAERRRIQARIQELAAERDRHLAKARVEKASAKGSSLDDAVIDLVRDRAAKAGYQLD